jgi:hypothetical protein
MHTEHRDPDEEIREESITPPLLVQRGRGGVARRPPTAVATDSPGAELLIVNFTDRAWRIEHESREIALMHGEDESVAYTAKRGILLANEETEESAKHSLAIDIAANTWGVAINAGEFEPGTFGLIALSRRHRVADRLPASAAIDDLKLLIRTENTLKALDILTVGETLLIAVDALLALPHYPLLTLFDLLEQLHGLRVI